MKSGLEAGRLMENYSGGQKKSAGTWDIEIIQCLQPVLKNYVWANFPKCVVFVYL